MFKVKLRYFHNNAFDFVVLVVPPKMTIKDLKNAAKKAMNTDCIITLKVVHGVRRSTISLTRVSQNRTVRSVLANRSLVHCQLLEPYTIELESDSE